MNIAINASRAKSGGGIRHIKGIIKEIEPEILKENNIHIWSYKNLLDKINSKKNIIKHQFYFQNLIYYYNFFGSFVFFQLN